MLYTFFFVISNVSHTTNDTRMKQKKLCVSCVRTSIVIIMAIISVRSYDIPSINCIHNVHYQYMRTVCAQLLLLFLRISTECGAYMVGVLNIWRVIWVSYCPVFSFSQKPKMVVHCVRKSEESIVLCSVLFAHHHK